MTEPKLYTTFEHMDRKVLPLYDFFMSLQKNGFSVTPAQIKDTTLVIEKFAHTVQDEAALANYISPIFASSEEEQLQFHELFDRYFSLGETSAPSLSRWKKVKKHLNKHWGKYLAGLFLLLLSSAFFLYKSVIIMKPYFEIRNLHDTTGLSDAYTPFQLTPGEELSFATIMHPYDSSEIDEIAFHATYEYGDGSGIDTLVRHRYEQIGVYTLKAYVVFYKNPLLKYKDTVLQKINVCDKQRVLSISTSAENGQIELNERVKLVASINGEMPDSMHWEEEDRVLQRGTTLDTLFNEEGVHYLTCIAFYGSLTDPCTIRKELSLRVNKPLTVNALIKPSPSATKLPEPGTNVKRFWWWLSGIASGVSFLLTLWFALAWNRTKRKVQREQTVKTDHAMDLANSFAGKKPPMEVPFHSKNYLLLPEPELSLMSRLMRRRIGFEETMLHVQKTIDKSIHSGGLFQPVQVPRTQQSEYLFLIDESNKNSQQVKLINCLTEILLKQSVLIDTYYYREEPSLCYNANEPAGISLEKMSSKFGKHILLLFGDGHQLLYPHYPVFDTEYLRILSRWKYKAIITPIPYPDWGPKELNILSAHLPVLPADIEGMLLLMQLLLNEERDFTAALDRERMDFYSTEGIDFEDIDQLESYCKQASWANVTVGDEQENSLFQWIAALAVYPKIRWELTLAIGMAVLDRYGQSAELNISNLLRIVRITWMKDGQFPDYIRLDLLKKLTRDNEVVAREAVLQLLYEVNENELNIQHFAYEEKMVQQVTNEFNLYAYDPVRYRRYAQAKTNFETLWKENKILDSPAKVYFKNPSSAWDNLISSQDGTTLDGLRSTVPIETYFENKKEGDDPENKLLLFLTGLSAIICLLSILALLFFVVLNNWPMRRFAYFTEPHPVAQNIRFSYADSTSYTLGKNLELYVDTSRLLVNNMDDNMLRLLSDDSAKRVQLIQGNQNLLDTSFIVQYDHYSIQVSQTKQQVQQQKNEIVFVFPSVGCASSSSLYHEWAKSIAKDLQLRDTLLTNPAFWKKVKANPSAPCLDGISFGNDVKKELVDKLIGLFGQRGVKLTMNEAAPFTVKENQVLMYARIDTARKAPTTKKDTAKSTVRLLLGPDCLSANTYTQWIQEANKSRLSKDIIIEKSMVTNLLSGKRSACVNKISAGRKVKRKELLDLINAFSKRKVNLDISPASTYRVGDNDILIYYVEKVLPSTTDPLPAIPSNPIDPKIELKKDTPVIGTNINTNMVNTQNNISTEVDPELAIAAKELNKDCPMMIDKETRLENVEALPYNEFKYNYTLLNYKKGSKDLIGVEEQLKQSILDGIMNNPELKTFRDKKVTMTYQYKDRKGQTLFTLSFTSEEYTRRGVRGK